VPACSALPPDVGTTQVRQEFFPYQLTELSPGSFIYIYYIKGAASKLIYLAIDSASLGSQYITGIQQMPPTLEIINITYPLVAGQLIDLLLSTTIVNYTSLTANSTGWRVGLLRPNGSSTDLGLMAQSTTLNGLVYRWKVTLQGSTLTQVSCCCNSG
jgi:hypothetical protein